MVRRPSNTQQPGDRRDVTEAGTSSGWSWVAHYKLENDPRFLKRVESDRRSLRAGKGVPLEDVGLGRG